MVNGMRREVTVWVLLAAGTILLAGCEDTVSSKQAKVRPPAATPVQVPASVREALPFPEHPVHFASLQSDPRPAIDILVAKVQASFDEGQKKYKAGNFDKARVDFDYAMDLVLHSGFQPDFDQRVSDLIDQLGEKIGRA